MAVSVPKVTTVLLAVLQDVTKWKIVSLCIALQMSFSPHQRLQGKAAAASLWRMRVLAQKKRLFLAAELGQVGTVDVRGELFAGGKNKGDTEP